jgi:hypothetical protein
MLHPTFPSTTTLIFSWQVERAHKMYKTGDFIAIGHFNADDWGPTTVRFMDYIVNDLGEKHWSSMFSALCSYSAQAAKEEAIRNGAPEEPHERVPLPASDPPSPARDD